jgi:predicted flap endonuclease-1-like 5' DNA nuclease
MRRNTIRGLFWLGIVAALILFGLMLWDHYENNEEWLGALVIAFVVVIVYLLILFLIPRDEEPEFQRVKPSPAATPAAPAAAPASGDLYYDYKGDVHDVIDVEGIGPVYAERLKKVGVETTARLCYEDPTALAKRIDVPETTVRQWQAMAELVKVNGIAKQYAEALVRSGVTGIAELKQRSAKEIAAQVNEHLGSLDVNVLGQNVTAKRVQGWQKAAAPMRKVRQAIPER